MDESGRLLNNLFEAVRLTLMNAEIDSSHFDLLHGAYHACRDFVLEEVSNG